MNKIVISILALTIHTNSNATDCQPAKKYPNPDYIDYVSPKNICGASHGIPEDLHSYYDRFITYKAPNGKKIPILAMKGVHNEQILRAYNILSMYLDSKDGTTLSSFKTKIANHIAETGNVLVLPHGEDRVTNIPKEALIGQPLFSKETPLDGSVAYVMNDWDRRDAAYEEILHFVHDNGIGTKYTDGVLKNTWQKEIEVAAEYAIQNKIWPINSPNDELQEWREEGSISQEYLASIVDAYYGLWDQWNEDTGSMWGAYTPKNRKEMPQKDPKGWEIAKQYFPSYMGYMSRIDTGYGGTFSLTYDKYAPYTAKSRYLLNARLTGSKDSNLLGNEQSNILMGNTGNNILDGASGKDYVQVTGKSTDYTIQKQNSISTQLIEKSNPSHIDTLKNIEFIIFQDKTINLTEQ